MGIINNLPQPSIDDMTLFRSVVKLDFVYVGFGGKEQNSGATGFFMRQKETIWLVTNRHCFDVQYGKLKEFSLAIKKISLTIPSKDEAGVPQELELDLKETSFHHCLEGDISAIAFNVNFFKDIYSLEIDKVVKSHLYESIYTGSQIMFIGYPKGLWDKKNSLPILRNATISSIPKMNYSAANQSDEPRVLVNGMSIGGNSGSPVFYLIGNMGLHLVGIMGGHYYDEEKASWDSEISLDTENTKKSHVGLSYFVKSSLIRNIEKWEVRKCNT